MIVIGLILKKRAAQNMELLFSRRKITAFLYARTVQCFRNVRHHRHDANGILGIRLRIQEPLDSLVMAGIQSDISNGVSVRVAPPFPMYLPERNGSRRVSEKVKGPPFHIRLLSSSHLLSVLVF